MKANKKLPLSCPSCSSALHVKSLYCISCETSVEGLYELPILAQLTPEEQTLILQFFKASGSIKELASQMNLSYPTMRNTLDDLIEKVIAIEQSKIENHEK
ncbi:MAG: DUF2089 family protein [Crocinitomicaceae bacterium]|jgi:hypothetical protein|nr:MAG: DUF2089 family protein [Crocinitomicaceae bacterium]